MKCFEYALHGVDILLNSDLHTKPCFDHIWETQQEKKKISQPRDHFAHIIKPKAITSGNKAHGVACRHTVHAARKAPSPEVKLSAVIRSVRHTPRPHENVRHAVKRARTHSRGTRSHPNISRLLASDSCHTRGTCFGFCGGACKTHASGSVGP